jgi:hypothetical protein
MTKTQTPKSHGRGPKRQKASPTMKDEQEPPKNGKKRQQGSKRLQRVSKPEIKPQQPTSKSRCGRSPTPKSKGRPKNPKNPIVGDELSSGIGCPENSSLSLSFRPRPKPATLASLGLDFQRQRSPVSERKLHKTSAPERHSSQSDPQDGVSENDSRKFGIVPLDEALAAMPVERDSWKDFTKLRPHEDSCLQWDPRCQYFDGSSICPIPAVPEIPPPKIKKRAPAKKSRAKISKKITRRKKPTKSPVKMPLSNNVVTIGSSFENDTRFPPEELPVHEELAIFLGDVSTFNIVSVLESGLQRSTHIIARLKDRSLLPTVKECGLGKHWGVFFFSSKHTTGVLRQRCPGGFIATTMVSAFVRQIRLKLCFNTFKLDARELLNEVMGSYSTQNANSSASCLSEQAIMTRDRHVRLGTKLAKIIFKHKFSSFQELIFYLNQKNYTQTAGYVIENSHVVKNFLDSVAHR